MVIVGTPLSRGWLEETGTSWNVIATEMSGVCRRLSVDHWDGTVITYANLSSAASRLMPLLGGLVEATRMGKI